MRVCSTVKKVISSMGGATFGIYLLHIMIMNTVTFERILYVLTVEWKINDMAAAFLYCMAVMAVGYCITIVLKRIPGIKRLI